MTDAINNTIFYIDEKYDKDNEFDKQYYSFVLAGNRQTKFIRWLRKISEKIIIWKTQSYSIPRYSKYHDHVRYSEDKLKRVLKNSKVKVISIQFTNEFLVCLKLLNMPPLNYFILNWNASQYTISTNLQINKALMSSKTFYQIAKPKLEIEEIYERVA